MRSKLKINKFITKELYFKGYNYIINKYWEIKPEKIYSKCLEYKHISYKKCSKTLKYYIYAKNYEAKDYKCLIIGYSTLIKKICVYLSIKYMYCKGFHFAIFNNCPKKRVAIKKIKKKKQNKKYLKESKKYI